MALIWFPILLIVREEKYQSMPYELLLLPFTISWLLLILYFILSFITVLIYRHKAKYVIPKKYKEIECVRGWKYSHPKNWNIHHFVSKATNILAAIIFFFYLGIFIKVYIIREINFIGMGLISFIPISVGFSLKTLVDIFMSMCGKETWWQNNIKLCLIDVLDDNFTRWNKVKKLGLTTEQKIKDEIWSYKKGYSKSGSIEA